MFDDILGGESSNVLAGPTAQAVVTVLVVLLFLDALGLLNLNLFGEGFSDPAYNGSRVAGIQQRWYGGLRSDTGAETLPISGDWCPTRHPGGYGFDAVRLEYPHPRRHPDADDRSSRKEGAMGFYDQQKTSGFTGLSPNY